jgi:phosphatidylethanolamine/phosphatidyl-N-methylethanolamine N-methyltransferase
MLPGRAIEPATSAIEPATSYRRAPRSCRRTAGTAGIFAPTVSTLDSDLDRYYAEHYDAVVHSGAAGAVQRRFHLAVERPWRAEHEFPTVLELGATGGEHLRFVRHRFARYTMLDIRDSRAAREVARRASAPTAAVDFQVGDAQDLAGIDDASVDRLISMCLLHHLDDPRGSLVQWRRVVRPGGVLSIFLPCDPGALWRAGRALTTFRGARASGYSALAVRYINACDHRNHFASLRWMIAATFADDDVSIRRFPFAPLDAWNANLYWTFQIRTVR